MSIHAEDCCHTWTLKRRWKSTRLQGSTSQKTAIFSVNRSEDLKFYWRSLHLLHWRILHCIGINVWEVFVMTVERGAVSWWRLQEKEFVCPVYITARPLIGLFLNNSDNYTAVLTLASKSIRLCSLFQDVSWWRGNYNQILSLLLYLGSLLLYYFVEKSASVVTSWYKRTERTSDILVAYENWIRFLGMVKEILKG